MKPAVITFIIALALSCLLSPFGGMPGYPQRAGLSAIELSPPAGVKRGESVIPEIKVTDGYRHQHYMTDVVDTDDQEQSEFPMQALQ